MKRITSILLIFLLSISCRHIAWKPVYDKQTDNVPPIKSQDYYIKVVGITDGDTFTGLISDIGQIVVPIIGVPLTTPGVINPLLDYFACFVAQLQNAALMVGIDVKKTVHSAFFDGMRMQWVVGIPGNVCLARQSQTYK